MKLSSLIATCALIGAALAGPATHATVSPQLDLSGYTHESGIISVLHSGNSFDPYFAMQAPLLAHDNGMDISVPAENSSTGWRRIKSPMAPSTAFAAAPA